MGSDVGGGAERRREARPEAGDPEGQGPRDRRDARARLRGYPPARAPPAAGRSLLRVHGFPQGRHDRPVLRSRLLGQRARWQADGGRDPPAQGAGEAGGRHLGAEVTLQLRRSQVRRRALVEEYPACRGSAGCCSQMKSSHAHRVLGALLAVLTACASAPQAPPPDPSRTAAAFAARRLDALPADAALAGATWSLQQWFDAALRLNPQLAESRAHVFAVAAAERTAAEHPNPAMDLFGEYVDTAARSGAWLYGVSLDFLLRRPGDRARARRNAAVQTAVAESDLAEAIWRVRASLRLALLDVASARDEAALLESLVGERQALLASGRARADAGQLARTETLASELELARAEQRLDHARARQLDAEARFAAAVGLPVSALEGVAVRWDRWADIAALVPAAARDWRGEALIGRPEIVRAVREYDLADISLQGELAKRWPEAHVSPGYTWGHDGIRQDPLNDVIHENALGVGFELPVFNQHQGAIGEAVARRVTAGDGFTDGAL